jgi:hypothetical protein
VAVAVWADLTQQESAAVVAVLVDSALVHLLALARLLLSQSVAAVLVAL